MEENYKICFRNIEKLWNVSIYFNDVKNILNCEIKKDSFGKENLIFNPKIIYGTDDFEKQNEINKFFLEQISKIQKRKKIIFEMTIKDRDCFLKNKKDNRKTFLIKMKDNKHVVCCLFLYHFFFYKINNTI